jgi:hypothetical protein
MGFKRHSLFAPAGVLFLFCGSAFADITFSTTSANAGTGNVEAAQAMFDLVGTTLTVTLTNTATVADIEKKFQPADILTAVFFGTTKIDATPETASLTAGSKEVNANGTAYTGSQPLGGEWAYKGGFSPGITDPAGGPKLVNGISSSGLNIFGDGNFGCTKGKNGTCQMLGGQEWGIVPNRFVPMTGTNVKSPLERDSVTFVLSVGQGFKLSSINNVVFQYGTSTSEFSMQGVNTADVTPEPSYLFVLGPCLAALIFRRIRRKSGFTEQAQGEPDHGVSVVPEA